MKDIRPVKGKYYIARLIEEGEHEHQDFKFAISDAMKIARSISAFANNDGGHLLVGVKDNGVIAGVRNEEDIYVIEQAARMYCRPEQDIDITAFLTDGGVVLRARISPSPTRPVLAREPDGHWRAYYRVKDENILASPLMVKVWRRQSEPTGAVVSLTGADRAVISLLENRDGCELHDIACGIGISLAAAEESVVNLSSMGVLEFRYCEGRFRIFRIRNS